MMIHFLSISAGVAEKVFMVFTLFKRFNSVHQAKIAKCGNRLRLSIGFGDTVKRVSDVIIV